MRMFSDSKLVVKNPEQNNVDEQEEHGDEENIEIFRRGLIKGKARYDGVHKVINVCGSAAKWLKIV